MNRFKKLDDLKKQLDSFRPLPEVLIQNLHENLVLQWTYNSNAIEGNTLTLKETKVALEGITVGGKTLREHFEAINHKEAILYVEDIVSNNEEFSLWHIKQIHSLIMRNINDGNAGKWRTINVTISGAEHVPPDFVRVPDEMEKFEKWYHGQSGTMHPVELASRVHCDFVKIHPFADGNGRTARLLMNLELLKSGFPAVVLSVKSRLQYYELLDQAHLSEEYDQFINFIADLVEESFLPYWHALGK